jgi:hypothetical protein
LFECFFIFPANDSFDAPLAKDITNDVLACGHMTFILFAFGNINDFVEQVGLAMRASKVPAQDVLLVRKVRLAFLAAINLLGIQVIVECESHDGVVGGEMKRTRHCPLSVVDYLGLLLVKKRGHYGFGAVRFISAGYARLGDVLLRTTLLVGGHPKRPVGVEMKR